MSNIFGFVTSLFAPVTNTIDELHFSGEEKAVLSNALAKMQFDMNSKLLEYETKIAEKSASIIEAEIKSESKLTRLFRPVVVLTFTALIVLKWFGLSSSTISPELELQLFEIIKYAMSGYIVSRGLEKTVKAYVGSKE